MTHCVKDSLDIQDEHNMEDVWMHEGVVYSGNTTLITDQTHKKEHIPSSLAAAVLGLYNTSTPSTETTKNADIWTDIDAQEMYLNEKPPCYLILGKSGLDSYNLGEALSKKYNCVHLCPKTIINDEIQQGNLSGRCLDFNMKHNKVCTFTTVMPMLKQKIKSPAVLHRGYVISGLPIGTVYKKPYCLVKNHSGEEALYNAEEILNELIYNLKRKKPKTPGPLTSGDYIGNMAEEEYDEEEDVEEEKKEEEMVEAGEEEEEEIAAELPKFILTPCSDVFVNVKPYYETRYAIALGQLHELFNLDILPNVIIYLTCPDPDVVTKRYNKYINYKTGHDIIEPFLTKTISDVRWPTQYNLSDYDNPHSNLVFNPKYYCRPPINFKQETINQLCNFRHYFLPYFEQKVLDYEPKQVIKLDSRISVYQLMHQITERLLLLDINPVLIPEPLYLTEPPEDLEDFWNIVQETQVIRSDDVLSFKRYASPWFNRCPVELKKRHSVIGKPKYAVMMFKHVYLLSSLNNFISFCRNPRPFLKIKYLEPTCRIIITGTKSSGKTMIAECLSWIFDTPVTSFHKILENKKQKKYEIYSKTIYSEIVPVIEDARFLEWHKKEQDREASLKTWNQLVLKSLKKYLPLLIESFQYIVVDTSANKQAKDIQEDQEGEQRELSIKKEENEEQNLKEQRGTEKVTKELKHEEKGLIIPPVPDPLFVQKYNSLREKLSFLPILDNVDRCNAAIESGDLSQYAPFELKTMTEKPLLPFLGDADVTKAISEYIVMNDLQKEIEPTIEEVMYEIIKLITTLDEKHHLITNGQECYGKYLIDGFPSEPEYGGLLSSAKLMPDYTIALIENREIDTELMVHYLHIDKCMKNYHETLLFAEDPLILCKRQTKVISIPKMLDIKMIVYDLIYDCLQNLVDSGPDSKIEDIPDTNAEMITSFNYSIEKFREDWDTIKVKLEDEAKCFIEIELENKTDVQILQQMLLQIRQGYYLQSETNEDEEIEDDEHVSSVKDLITYNNSENLCETSNFCPYTYYNYGLLWEGKKEFSLKYDNKTHYFAKEEFLERFRQDITKYQAYNDPFKKIPKLKICVIGCSGSGLSALSSRIAMELGLIHIHFEDIINYYYMPRHFKNVGRKYANPFTDEPLEEEGIVEFQMDEENPTLVADIFSNEKELRRIVYNYYEYGHPILPKIMHTIITKLWYTEPYKTTGFVLDGYPRIPQDVEDLMHCNCIPDMVIDVESNADIGIQRLGPIILKRRKLQLKEAKEAHRVMMETQQHIWKSLITEKTVVRLIIEEIFDNCVEKDAAPVNKDSLSVDSFVFDAHPTGSTNVDPKLFQIYNELIQKYPMPQDTRVWVKTEEMREEIEAKIEAVCDTEYDNIQALKELLLDNKINIESVDGTKPFSKVFRLTLAKLNPLRNKCQSFFEQTYIITTDIAELLLAQGYFFLSKFGRLCPVYVRENPEIILNSYKISRRKGTLFPVVHRAYVYFISNKDNVYKFRTNPLKYITNYNIKSYRPYTLRIGIAGAPKTGRSTLVGKLARQYNLMCISRGMALRSVIENMHWTELGRRILKKLYEGGIIEADCIMDAVQTVAMDHRTETYGYVLDGFPSLPYEAMALVEKGLYPTIIFEIISNKEKILENSQNEVYYDTLKYMPPYPKSLMEYKYQKFLERGNTMRGWVYNDYQNLWPLDGTRSKWESIQEVNENVKKLTSQIYSYLAKVATSVVPAKVMNISNALFEKKMSRFKNLCPACLRKNSTIRHNGYPVDKNGVLQYGHKLYWVCPDHVAVVTKFPDYYLYDDIEIPEIPAVVKIIDPHNVYENGICIVSYAQNLPSQILKRGTHQFAAAYKSKIYLFCSEECLKIFLEKPNFYADITVFKGSSWYPKLSLKKLPDLGYLEQTLANILTEACCSVNAVRPKYPGLGIELSAVLHIALYLKTHNPRLPKDRTTFYQKALRMYETRCKLILDLGLRMRSMENPFTTYPECHHATPKQYTPLSSSSSMGVKPFSIDASISEESFEKHYPAMASMKSIISLDKLSVVLKGSSIGGSSIATFHDDDDISYSSKYYAALGSTRFDI